ncbi:MAG: PilN domain-containing protein [Clostridia bacterium]
MNGSLGIYIGDKVIKYAKLSVDNQKRVGVEAVGTKFIASTKEDTIKEILQEVGGANVPVSLNLKNETYENISLISKLSKSDMAKVIEIEFEDLCEKKGTNAKLFDKRHMITDQSETEETTNVLIVRATKAQVEDIKNSVHASVAGILPTQITITNLVQPSESNYIILNLEEQTQIITVIKGKIVKLNTLNLGLSTILEKLSYELNSYSKAYEVCKSLNVYGDSSSESAPEYEKVVEPILQDIIHRFEAEIIEYRDDLKKIYITGVGPMFANLDKLFEEYFQIRTELLKPHFLSPASISGNLAQVLESNSAISLAYEVIEPAYKFLNFSAQSVSNINVQDKIKDIFSSLKNPVNLKKDSPKKEVKNVGGINPLTGVAAAAVTPMQQTTNLTGGSIFEDPGTVGSELAADSKILDSNIAEHQEEANATVAQSEEEELNLVNDVKKQKKKNRENVPSSGIDSFASFVTNLSIISACAVITYITVGVFFDKQITSTEKVFLEKTKEISSSLTEIESDINYVKQVTGEYEKINTYITDTTSKIENQEIGKFTTYNVAKFLQELMNIIPKNVTLEKISTNENKNVTITAKSPAYADLGYFISRIKLDGTLKNIQIKNITHGAEIKIEIGGDLP